jgi:Flp pilus assembly protein TadG
MQRARKNSRERGASLLESALVLLTFLMMVIGVMDFGQVLYLHQSLVERARSAARYGAINPTNSAGIQNMAVYNSPTVASGQTAMLAGLTTAMVDVQNPDINTPNARVVVTISGYPMQFFTPGLARAFTGRSVMVAMTAESQVP